MVFGQIIKSLRTRNGITLETLGGKVKKSKGYLSGIENQKVRPPTPKIVAALAAALGIDASLMAQVAYVEKAPKSLASLPEFEAFKQSVMARIPVDLWVKIPADGKGAEKPAVVKPAEEEKPKDEKVTP